jgi:hypothetical protein
VTRLTKELYVAFLIVVSIAVDVVSLCGEILAALTLVVIKRVHPGCLIPSCCDRVAMESPFEPIIRALPETTTAVS